VATEREACAKLCEEKDLYFQYDFIAPYDVADSCAEEIRARGDEMKDGIALESIAHPEGDPVPDDHEINPDSLETVEIRMPVMPEDQLETWMHNMIRACNRSTCDSDINVLKLIQHIENLYEKGRADEREQAEQAEQWDTSDMAHRPNGLTVEQAEKQIPTTLCGPNLEQTLNAAGFYLQREQWDTSDMAHRPNGLTVDVTDLIKRAIAEEREACAKLCDAVDAAHEGDYVLAKWCATAIRGRTEPKSDFKTQMDDN
jgi:hypothetical protein